MHRYLGCVLGLFSLISCETSPDPIADIGLDYFPLKVGAYQIYNIDETQISQSIEQNFVYELKLTVEDSTINQAGGVTYFIQRQRRDNANQPWYNIDALSSRITDRSAIVQEGNTSFVKITFPTVNGLAWDGNTFNSLGGDQVCGENKNRPCDNYELKDLGEKFILADGTAFAETLKVVQNENTDLIVKFDVRTEVYAKEVGLIFKESVVLEYCSTSGCLGQQKIDKGLKFKQVIKEYGTE